MKNWREVLIDPSTTVWEAINLIDSSASQIALVVDQNERLIGTVTDGDIRRGILKAISLDKPVQEIMNPNPTFSFRNERRESILEKMKLKHIHHMPILDENKIVIDIETFDEIIQSPIRDNWVILMAGGLGTRLRPLTDDRPKPLLKLDNKPILEIILENFIEHGFRRFYITLNYKAEMIKEYFGDGSAWGVEIRYVHEDQRLGTAGALSLLPDKLEKPFFVMNGDLLTKVNFRLLLDFHLEYQSKVTLCIKEHRYQIPYGVVKLDQHRLKEIAEKPQHRFFINAGIYVLHPSVLSEIPKNQFYDMPDLFERLIKKKQEITVFPIREYWLDIGRIDDFERAKLDYKEEFG